MSDLAHEINELNSKSNTIVNYVKQIIEIYKKNGKDVIPVTPQLLLEIAERIEFLEARQIELQEEGTKLVTQRRELKAEFETLMGVLNARI